MHTEYSRELVSKRYLDRLDADPGDDFSYKEERIKFKRQSKRKDTMHDNLPSLNFLELEEFRRYVKGGRGNYEGVIFKDIIIDFDISNCNFKKSIFADVHFARGVNLHSCIFDGAKFINCKFDTMVASGIEFNDSILLNTDIEWDGNFVQGTTVYNDKATGWDELKGSYTGNGARFHVILSLLYFLPIAMSVMSNYFLTRYQEIIEPYSSYVPMIDKYFSSLDEKVTVFHGVFETDGFTGKIVLIGVFIYQLQRIFLTFYVGKLADKQKFCNKMPGLVTLGSLKKMHFFNTVLTVVVFYGAVLNLFKLMKCRMWV
nr:hypothetical protein [uncultured Desulfobulbus sp.]